MIIASNEEREAITFASSYEVYFQRHIHRHYHPKTRNKLQCTLFGFLDLTVGSFPKTKIQTNIFLGLLIRHTLYPDFHFQTERWIECYTHATTRLFTSILWSNTWSFPIGKKTDVTKNPNVKSWFLVFREEINLKINLNQNIHKLLVTWQTKPELPGESIIPDISRCEEHLITRIICC